MRQIKFRGKRLDNDEWVYGDLIHIDKSDIGIVTDYDHWQGCRVDPETVGQFTGLLDCNGKEIYEGDVVRYIDCNDTISINEVRYADAGFTPVCEIAWMADIEGTECEVIGNRFDHPDLLNGK